MARTADNRKIDLFWVGMGTRGMSEAGLKLSWVTLLDMGNILGFPEIISRLFPRVFYSYFPIISQKNSCITPIARPNQHHPRLRTDRHPTGFFSLPQRQHRQEPEKSENPSKTKKYRSIL